MNTRLLKAKRVEHGLRQIDLARKLHIAEKTMNKKECSTVNCFTADEMLLLMNILSLSAADFNAIFLTMDYQSVKHRVEDSQTYPAESAPGCWDGMRKASRTDE